MPLTDKQKKYIIAGVGVTALVLLIRSSMPKTDIGTGTDLTGNGSAGTTSNANFNATAIAGLLYDAMKEMGTDEEAIMDVLQPLSAAQFQQVVTKFGKRNYNPTTGNVYAVWGFSLTAYDLKFWLKSELSTYYYDQIKLKFKSLNYL